MTFDLSEVKKNVEEMLAFETRLAEVFEAEEDRHDIEEQYNPRTVTELQALMPVVSAKEEAREEAGGLVEILPRLCALCLSSKESRGDCGEHDAPPSSQSPLRDDGVENSRELHADSLF